MNQEKIGKLIAKLRKEKGLTQQQLGDMIGVGYRAVSKWETGLTLPDISNINELCKILGITSDELLKGELNKKKDEPSKSNKKFNKKLLLLLIPIIIIGIIIGIIIKENNKTYEYDVISGNINEYNVEGSISFKNNKMEMNIKKIEFEDYNFLQTIIKNYQYMVYSDKKLLFGFGYSHRNENLINEQSISEFQNDFKINYYDKIDMNRNLILKNNILIDINFVDIDNNIINKKIDILLIPKEKSKSTT